jgi:hypothetical protein
LPTASAREEALRCGNESPFAGLCGPKAGQQYEYPHAHSPPKAAICWRSWKRKSAIRQCACYVDKLQAIIPRRNSPNQSSSIRTQPRL